ncbi:MAG: plasmid mobilization relaxosome protein MobC [Gammaproteobacteria bacterium]
MGAYIRERLLNGEEAPRKKPKKRKKRPIKDIKALSQVLAELGQSRIANNLNQLAKASNTGSLPVNRDDVMVTYRLDEWLRHFEG